MELNSPKVVILGAGFGGLYAAKCLGNKGVDVLVIDQRNHHLFQPLLYQVATASLSAPAIAFPIRKILRRFRNERVYLAQAVAINVERKEVILADGKISYDYLIVATGATHSYFGHTDWAPFAPGLKTIEDAFVIRKRVLLAFEQAEREESPQKRKHLLRFVIVGGGPTGIELAGALGEIARYTLARDYRNFDPREAEVILLEGSDRLLPTYPMDLSEKAEKQLFELGVETRTKALVTQVDSEGVSVGEERIIAGTVIWAAGVQASPLLKTLNVPLDRAGRVLVQPDLTIPGHPEVFVIGDACALKSGQRWVPGVAPAAIQQGKHTAHNILRALKKKTSLPFCYRDKGSLATIGRSRAVADFGRFRFSGFWAWWLWLFIHIFFLIGFRNRLVVLFEWGWAYLTFQRTARLVIAETPTSSQR